MADPLVVDASLLLRLILPGSDQGRARALAARWAEEERPLHAPTLWRYEVTSALCKAAHLQDLSQTEAKRLLTLVQALEIQSVWPDDAQMALAMDWTIRLGRGAAYDSFYLALAESLGCDLWTADQRLWRAVDLPWVRWLEA